MKYGDIELVNSKIYNLKVESLDVDPVFNASDVSRIYYNSETNNYKFNNGTAYVDLSLPANYSTLIDTLGNNWINSDFTFNPTPFNDLNTITGLTSNDNLFSVISQLDSAIHSIGSPNLADLNDVTIPENIQTGYVLYYNNNDYSFIDIDTLFNDYSTVKLIDLHDIETGTLANGGSLIYNGATATFSIININQVFDDFYNTDNHSIQHELGLRYFAVTVINAQTNTTIPDAVVTFIDDNNINVALSSSAPIKVILTIPFVQ